ncbi:GMC oxidoreductase [Nodosilinea nodulosa]|uniref:GMC oxidoreductase n=1 Tax=Nodosilinea nodulosa TaxID=416001 RepID=UPI0002F7A656|nr:GMC family oxidoreductase [Nodosilinea nodulosa]
MFLDAREIESNLIEKDICIVGSGPAGMSLAREFIGQKADVCLLESGGIDPDAQVQSLAMGTTVGEPINPPGDVCRRQVGGNSNAWSVRVEKGRVGVRYVPFHEVDFEKRDWLPNSGWPIDYEQLLPYYHRAQAVCQSGPFDYDVNTWEDSGARRLPLDETLVQTSMFQFGPSKPFFEDYRDELARSANVTLYSQATVVELEANESGTAVTRIRVACLNGKQFWVSARVFVLACGGFENARLMLLSNRQQPAGLGNSHDVVGRYFNDHPFVMGGHFKPYNPKLFNQTALYDLRHVNGVPVMGHLKLSKEVMEREHLLNMSACFFPRPSKRKMTAISSLQYLVQSRSLREWPDELPQNLLRILMGTDHIAQTAYLVKTKNQPWLTGFSQGGWSNLDQNEKRFRTFEIIHQIEQSPDPSNRVALSRDKDVFGCPKLEVHWRWSKEDAERIARGQEIMANELHRAGIGEYEMPRENGWPLLGRPSGSHHLMGTTRMHDDPKQGVVDANCRVHGLSNLYVAGSSVFPTGGYSNPTLTIVALSLRLGDLIKQELAAEVLALS